jgi:hypothetical protein
VANDEHPHGALPKLYGAPAYARPPRPVDPVARPVVDTDDLPLQAYQTPDERDLAATLTPRPYRGSAPAEPLPPEEPAPMLRPRPFRLRAITERILAGEPRDGAGEG